MTRPDLYSEEEVVFDLASRCQRHGDQQRVAAEMGIGQGTLSNILTCGRGIGARAAEAIGYRRVVMFERID